MVVLRNRFKLESNFLSSSLPSELAAMTKLGDEFHVNGNEALCGVLPPEVASLSRSITSWLVQTGTSIGTVS